MARTEAGEDVRRRSPFSDVELCSDMAESVYACNFAQGIVAEQLKDVLTPSPCPVVEEEAPLELSLPRGHGGLLKEVKCDCGSIFIEDSRFWAKVCLDGTWQVGLEKHIIRGTAIHWADGQVTDFGAVGARTLSTVHQGHTCTARLDFAGQRLLWDDGRAWVYVSEEAELAAPPEEPAEQSSPPAPAASAAGALAAPAPAVGRLAALRRRSPAAPNGPPAPRPRPGRLEGAIAGSGCDPFTAAGTASGAMASPFGATPAALDELPAFRHLAALEEAVTNGQAEAGMLPTLPGFAGLDVTGGSAPSRAASLPRSARGPRELGGADGYAGASGAGGFFGAAPLLSPHPFPLAANTAAGMAGTEGSSATPRGPRVLFRDGTWGLQPPELPVARKPAEGTTQLGFRHSALRGAPLSRCGRGPTATARWIGTEGERLRGETWKSLGSSAHVAFFVNGGPQRMEPLHAPLCREGLLS